MFGYPQYPQQYPQYAQYPQPDYLDQLNRLKQQQSPPQQMQQQTNPDERIWVQGQGAAETYLVARNSFVRLWDSKSPIFYEKSADQTSRPYLNTSAKAQIRPQRSFQSLANKLTTRND